jgi:hypothetical protein
VLLIAKVAPGKDLLVGIAFLGKTEAWEEGGEPGPDASHGEPLVLAVQTPPLSGENM